MSPKFKRNLGRILPFGGIWLVISWFFIINDLSLTRNQNLNPDTDVTLTWPVIIFASFASASVGLLVGYLEMVMLNRRFKHLPFLRGLFRKLMLYLLIMVVLVVIFFPISASIETGLSIFDKEIIEKAARFFASLTFLNTLIQLGFSLMISLIYAGFSEHLGHQFLLNLVTGKYHKPQEEHRIFMFLDMNESTSIAEKLGHIKYFDLLQDYYEVMSDPIIKHEGEVYQYIGDEVVITWKAKEGTANNNCVECFFGIEENLRKHSGLFQERYGVVPHFKAGIHIGEVTTGEIGALKKEIVFTGDVLNSAARIQGLCKKYHRALLISKELRDSLRQTDILKFNFLGKEMLRGKESYCEIYAVINIDE